MEMRTFNFPLRGQHVFDEVRVLAWNVWYGNTLSHSDDIAAVLKSLDCDALLLSELIDPDFPRKIHELGYGGFFAETNYAHNLRRIGGGVGLFSRLPIEEQRVVSTLSGRAYRRCYLEAKLRITPDYVLTVGTTHHALPFEPGCESASEMLCSEVCKHEGRFLLAGDLNAFPTSRLIRRLEKQFTHLGPDWSEKSYNSTGLARLVFPGWWRRLDYGFATPDIASRVVEARFLKREPSDHRPLLLRLKIPVL